MAALLPLASALGSAGLTQAMGRAAPQAGFSLLSLAPATTTATTLALEYLRHCLLGCSLGVTAAWGSKELLDVVIGDRQGCQRWL